MQQRDQKYKSNLKNGRISDSEEIKKDLKAQATIETLLNDLSMSLNAEDKPLLPLALMLHQLFSRQDTHSRFCIDAILMLYNNHLHDIHCRLCELEEKNTPRYWLSKAKLFGYAVQFSAATIAAILAIIGFLKLWPGAI